MRAAAFHTLERQDPWKVHLQEVFAALEIPPGTMADNVAASVAMYCREFHPGGVQRTDLALLIARAFCAVNDRAAAERVLGSMQPHSRHVARWLEILSELHHFPLLLPYFSLGIIRPAEWAGAQVDRMWTLDFGRLALSESERHEMMLYRSIRAIIENMFVFWDATEGEGVLGLKGLAALNVEEGSRCKQTLTATDDLLEYMADLFRQQMQHRNWQSVPSLMNLDF
ncbi:hypothetical protein PDESU_05756 [Pontiella desulfatans]|uniref:Uncharacterized protein n=1 Tax=Pontiella desulfatans TaxID=2750659 RepID=A0A6C2UCL2_PONDE|nr:hypothetical protein [Pontiella desulfatans]VGO17161.1 hypothetical protein PDESU_05756 [Pontiella desulfatans]